MTNIEAHVDTIYHAISAAEDISGLGKMTLNDAYLVQLGVVAKHQAEGEAITGLKLGFTSHSKMEQMGVDSIIVGHLTDRMHLDAAVPLSLEGYIHPKLEPELVFHLGSDIMPAQTVSDLAQNLRHAVDKVAVGMELIDSRYTDFKFTLTDVIADNTSAAGYILGEWLSYPMALSGREVSFFIDGDLAAEATTDAILGDPEEAFVELAKMLLDQGFTLKAGDIILAGAVTPAFLVRSGQKFEARVAGFPALKVSIA